MAYFMCQLRWAKMSPEGWSDILLGVSMSIFWTKFTFKNVDSPGQCGSVIRASAWAPNGHGFHS